ncbi:hypothetical protein [Nocardia sp. alder85J]|uniref:hypothetical protein n=1 Tax=Nocardia sp. alder85J TaxID=2862949 RepID=UPI001CD674D2|nr:hypothetical protein [Nocardia sp. alder85J]MCX4094560.1 hypothetical protein [Nocardia sp. alder85J]
MSVAVSAPAEQAPTVIEITHIADLVGAGRIARAREIAGEALDRVSHEQRWVITHCVRILEIYPYDIARRKLGNLARMNPADAALIAQCTPGQDPRTYRPHAATPEDAASAAPVQTRYTTPRQATARDARRIHGDVQAGAYLAERGPEPAEERTPREQPAGYQHDIDYLAAREVLGLPCVCCFCERSQRDKQKKDGLCGECRSRRRPGFLTMAHGRPVPVTTLEEYVAAWCITVATRHPKPARAILRRRWQLSSPSARTVIEEVAKTYLPPQETAAPPEPTPEPAPAVMLDTQVSGSEENPPELGGMSSDADILARNDGFIDEIRDGTLTVEVPASAPQSQPAAA